MISLSSKRLKVTKLRSFSTTTAISTGIFLIIAVIKSVIGFLVNPGVAERKITNQHVLHEIAYLYS